MLYLKQCCSNLTGGASSRIPIAEQTALRFERALLSTERAARHRELAEALADDPPVAGWALRAAEYRSGNTINRVDEAVDWLCRELESELEASLIAEAHNGQSSDIDWRLPALVSRLSEIERQRDEFDKRLEREKLESLKELAYGASHEINNPLANIAARAQMLLADEDDPERQRKLAAIHRQAMRAHEMISDLMLFARPPKLKLASCDLTGLVRDVVDGLRKLANEKRTTLDCEPSETPIEVSGDATQLGVAIHALVVNALEATGDGGHVWVDVRWRDFDGQRRAEIAVRDDGPGISDEVRRHMFDPFYSGREAGRGLGFGLSKCWRIVTDHGGQVVVQRPAGGGAQIDILLPLTDRVPETEL